MQSGCVIARRCSFLLCASWVFSSELAWAEVGLILADPSGDPYSTTIAPGEPFPVEVVLSADQGVFGFTYFLSISPSTGSGLFALVDRTIPPQSPFQETITSNAAVLNLASALLDPHNDLDLGLLMDNPDAVLPVGTYTVAQLTIGSAPALAAGSYTLSISGGANDVIEANNLTSAFPITPGSYTIVIDDGSGGGSADPGGNGGGTDPGNGGGADPGDGAITDPDDDVTDPDGADDSDSGPAGDLLAWCGLGAPGASAMCSLLYVTFLSLRRSRRNQQMPPRACGR